MREKPKTLLETITGPYRLSDLAANDMDAWTCLTKGHTWAEYFETNVRWNAPLGSFMRSRRAGRSRPAVIVDDGPSLPKNLHVLRALQRHATVFATDRVLRRLVEEAKVVPEYVVNIDCSHLCIPFLINDVVKPRAGSIVAIFNIMSHPLLVSKWSGRKGFLIPYMGEGAREHMALRAPTLPTVNLGGNVVTAAMACAYALGAREIAVAGCDNGYLRKADVEHRGAKVFQVKANGKKVWTDEVYMSYTRVLLGILIAVSLEGVRFVNITEGGTIYGPPVEALTMKAYLAEKEAAPEAKRDG